MRKRPYRSASDQGGEGRPAELPAAAAGSFGGGS